MFQSQNWDVAGLNSIKKKRRSAEAYQQLLAGNLPSLTHRLDVSRGGLLDSWPTKCGDGSTMVYTEMWRLNRWTFQHRFSSFHLGLEMDAIYIYIYDIINRVSPHTLIGGRICCEAHHWKGLISEWWMISADVQTITNSTASWFHNASHMIHMPFPSLVILWSSMIFMGFFSKLSHQGPSFPAVWTSVSTAGHLSNFPI